MTMSRIKTLHELLKPRLVRWGKWPVGVIGSYDVISDQFPNWGLPKLGDLLPGWASMSGALLPWWGWLLILQTVFVYALFEYVRRNVPVKSEREVLTYDQAKDINLDLTCLLHFNVDVATLIAINRLINCAPTGEVPLAGDADHIADIKTAFRHFVLEAEKLSGGITSDSPTFHEYMRRAEREADDELARRLTENHELTKQMNQLREVLRLEKRRDAALEFLRWRLPRKESDVTGRRSDLMKNNERRSPP